MATKVFRLPDLGEGLTESEVVAWRVSAGDAVAVNQILAEVETAKAVVEVSSPFEGTVAELHADEGTTLDVGAPLVTFEVAAAEGEDEAAGRVPTLVGYGAAPDSGAPARRRRAGRGVAPATGETAPSAPESTAGEPAPAAPEAASVETPTAAPTSDSPVGERPRSTPPVRLLARRLGVDLETVTGSGAHGVILREDVERAAQGGAAASPAVVAGTSPDDAPGAGEAAGAAGGRTLGGRPRVEVEPVRGVRKATAAAMVQSAFTAPHVTEFLTVDVTESLELIDELKRDRAFRDLKLTPMTLAARACVLAMERTPEVNARWDEASGSIHRQNFVNLGFAAATPRGLMVPNVKDAQGMDLRALAQEIAALTGRAREGALTPGELTGGTFTLTNVGVFGVDTGTPIINPGEAAILCLGAVRRQPWEHRGEIALRDMVTLSLSFDHRLVDGEQGSRFLADVGALLRRPGMTLALV
ncbi:2-oxo acid dehydrogenase subunit E2 [Micrococcus flavus]|uniref:Dihydrolipoamide acetyltransferase component of pyruvate dehydrogenase complex n=1 Tax=Micrococcus flavus TaxID=384602 RepID=A0A4Y8X514_9MICC|nr:dihydrolipoamide acetyltransferase family protein [Micrococcus flavus]MBB4883164.1 pyruvate dehydrogenase E2 component (dihydrolipoamide acetyltransferase) [Micrococcus flavus]TFI04567.1 2-oxo acid dehydrogenase subunit E2 [Micrococcus flavus]GGK42922.1 dihydrolipoamide acetyltransferase component of pyruvate dehydrogenase complex [Micrococcus flavus]